MDLGNLPRATGKLGLDPAYRPIAVLLINPNATETMTLNCLESLLGCVPPDTVVYGYTAPAPAPLTIECAVDGIMSASAIIRDLRAKEAGNYFDAFLVACFSHHPLTDALREEFDKPAAGIMESAIYTARILGYTFGIVSTDARAEPRHRQSVEAYGMTRFYVGAASSGYTVAELKTAPFEDVVADMGEASMSLVKQRGADCLLLGCAGMTQMKAKMEELVGPAVQVLDGALCGVNILSGLVRMGCKTSKNSLFRSSMDARLQRNQTYL
ncbi:hypothetical protein KL905_004269 [Ogataea polymorpha]|nr:hypothetical protein KL936_004360 [Ogataea polymorpha]KAG7918190.1 hypothetical protein KL905_004269 [Ogataea polymorpha]